MANAYSAQSALVRLLVDTESVEVLRREGLDPECIPSAEVRPIVAWALEHFDASAKAPTIQVMEHRWGDQLSDLEIDMEEDPEEAIEQTIVDLQEAFVRTEAGRFSRDLAESIAVAAPEDRVDVFIQKAARMAALAIRLQPRTSAVDLRSAAAEALADYDAVVASGNPVRGMTFGLPEVDAYTRGIWDEELCVVAAPPKSKKSWFTAFVAYESWKRERVCALITLENSISMTVQRIACVANGVSISDLMDGTLSPEEREKLRWWVHDVMGESDVPLPILSPDESGRSAAALVASARARGADELIVDQLSHMEVGDLGPGARRMGRPDEIREMVQGLKRSISTGRHRMPAMLIHQINREGVKYLEQAGRLRSYHGADGAEVERSASFMFALFATEEMVTTQRAALQPTAVRRTPPHPGWELNWSVDVGRVSVRGELEDE